VFFLASLCLGEGRSSSAGIAGQGAGAVCPTLPTQEGLCAGWLPLPMGLKLLKWKAL